MALRLVGVDGVFAVCQLPAGAAIPGWATSGELFSVTRTKEELSLVCHQDVVPTGVQCQGGWRCLRVAGTLPFALVGVLAALTVPLAEVGVSVFVFSTYDTDYLLVQGEVTLKAIAALRAAGHAVEEA